jgi:hypothetical protein
VACGTGTPAGNAGRSLTRRRHQDHPTTHFGVAKPEHLARPKPKLGGQFHVPALKLQQKGFASGLDNAANHFIEFEAELSADGLLNRDGSALEIDRQGFAAGNANRLGAGQHTCPRDSVAVRDPNPGLWR